MLKKTKRDEEEKKKETEEEKGEEGHTGGKKKRSPAEIRLEKELIEIDLPKHAQMSYPDPNNIMQFRVNIDLTKEECLWKGAKYQFTVNVSRNYPHEAPKCHCDT